MKAHHPAILLIRRDNIGDLILTTPLFEALRRRYPEAYLAALVNSYNAPAIAGNPYLDAIFSYTKGKHADGESVWRAYCRRIGLLWKLRQMRFDYVVLPNGGPAPRALKLASMLRPAHIVGFSGAKHDPGVDMPIEHGDGGRLHETEDIFRLLAPLDIAGPIPSLTMVPEPDLQERIMRALPQRVAQGSGPLVALHLSARKEKQRWPVERFAELARRLHAACQARFLIFWSPGDANNPFHPGDDSQAASLLSELADLPAAPVRTGRLGELIAGMSLANYAILSDGGAMHVAAGLGKPIVCFFGNSSAERWHPWGVPYKLLQPESHDVGDVTVGQAEAAFFQLLND